MIYIHIWTCHIWGLYIRIRRLKKILYKCWGIFRIPLIYLFILLIKKNSYNFGSLLQWDGRRIFKLLLLDRCCNSIKKQDRKRGWVNVKLGRGRESIRSILYKLEFKERRSLALWKILDAFERSINGESIRVLPILWFLGMP